MVEVPACLEDLDPVEGGARSGPANANGVDYGHAVGFYASDCYPSWSYTEFDLGRRQQQFTAVAAMRDDAASVDAVSYEIALDGVVVSQGQLAFGQQADIALDVTNALRLRVGT